MINKLSTIFFVVIILSFCKETKSQNIFSQETFISPEISIGYTFGTKFNIGFGLDLGYIDKNIEDLRYGISISYDLIKVKDRFHRHRYFNLMVQNSFADVKFGRGRMRNGWGYENRNRCIVHGFSSDISLNYPSIYSPKIGYRNFIYNRKDWAWFETQYHSIYFGYEYFEN